MKTQMRFQKIIAMVTLILAAVTLVYAFSFCTGSLAYAFYGTTKNFGTANPINADELFDTSQSFNDLLVVLCIIYIVITVTLYITSSHSRRKYYITNYVSIIVTAVFAVVLSVYAISMIGVCQGLFNQLDFETYKQMYENGQLQYYSDSNAVFALGYVLFILVIVNAAVLILNMLWKIKLMRGEAALLKDGRIEEVA